MTNNIEVLRGAVARGWCSPENAGKEVDPVLAEAIVQEIVAALAAMPPSAVPEGWREFIQDCALNRDGVHDAAQRSARAIALLAAAKQKEGDHG